MKRSKVKYRLKNGETERIVKGQDVKISSSDDLTHDEFFGEKSSELRLDESDTGEGANEGLGDGRIGRPARNAGE